MAHSDETEDYYSSSMSDQSDASDSSDSQEDPTFDLLEETRSSFSSLSVNRKSKCPISKEKDENRGGELYITELDDEDKKSYETIQKIIEGGQVQRLKVDQCKIYLRKHGLRLAGRKEILIQRIKEHLDIVNGEGEKKYPPSSFVVNCKGDACTGDVVLFEQNVYETFSIASRSATGPPCGTRLVAGRIVKESYGAAKQQHTFTIEVLWSKGEKPLPPLHPLLIKGRNLYRLKTMRQECRCLNCQKWEDEGERQRILSEKHARGFTARSQRETRVHQREMQNMLKSNRGLETKTLYRNEEETRKQNIHALSINSKNLANQLQQQEENMQDTSQAQCFTERPTILNANRPRARFNIQKQPLTHMNRSPVKVPPGMNIHEHYANLKHSKSSDQQGSSNGESKKHNTVRHNTNRVSSVPERYVYKESMNPEFVKSSSQWHNEHAAQNNFCHGNLNFNPPRSARQTHASIQLNNFNAAKDLFPVQRSDNSKLCRYYAQGRCYYGQKCKYLHQS